ncbi:MAG: thiamine pyrophosphate-binding protein [Rhodovarius sp.]|nr:thiamine pyrophosphate-binding protein [Rhodovarius sp.]MDW8315915.1 thiamine pyrophosphate-binding protein [Rhodovarius sp.]
MESAAKGAARGADLLWAALKAAGVSRLFSLSGNHIMEVYDAGFEDATSGKLPIIHVRHEAAALHMADAWARLTGEVGVALVTGGQGHTNAVAALPTAAGGEVPVLLLSGHAPVSELGLGAFQETPQVETAAPLCKAAWMVTRVEEIPQAVARAVAIAQEGRPGPVHLSLPTDVLEGRGSAEIIPPAPRAMPLSPEAADAIAGLLGRAERPLLVASGTLNTPAGRAALAGLEAALGLPVLVMESPRGLKDPTLRAAGQLFGEADLVLLLGKPLDFTLGFGRCPPFSAAARWAVVEPDPRLIDRAQRLVGERLALAVQAAALPAVQTLSRRVRPARPAWADQLRRAADFLPAGWADLPEAGTPHPVPIARRIAACLRPGDVLINDGGEFGQWMLALLRPPPGGLRICNGVAGAIGASIPFAIAARAARPDNRVVAVMGDGSFGFHMAEFETAVRHGLPFVAIIGNDGAWNAEHQIQLRAYGANRAHGCAMLPGTRYDLAVRALGGHGEVVDRLEDFAPALERALASRLPACVNVVMPGEPAPQIRLH